MSTNEELKAVQRAMVLACLHTGRDLANSGMWISAHTGLSERYVRQRIEELRNAGYLICNEQNGQGYYLAETDEEVEKQYRQMCDRAMSILRSIKPFRNYLRRRDEERGDQMSFEDMVIEEILNKGEL